MSASLDYSLQDVLASTSLDDLLTLARKRYDIVFEPLTIGDTHLELLQIRDMATYIEALDRDTAPGEKLELPFWAKIWPTSVLLGYVVQKIPSANAPELLEIGAGIGICGLAAAKAGFRATITDIAPDAALFTHINILKNNLVGQAKAAVADFTSTRLDETYDIIIGSEVLYMEPTYRALAKFLNAHLKPNANSQIVLARDYHRKPKKFFKLIERDFNIDEKPIGFKPSSGDGNAQDRQLSLITRLTPKKHA
ncbi:class I SAM-dependent methyltransferase [Desulfovibrio inopinatus]|uniref:class I SAM-dependent methyltransferase n=1 Tax=Desulfovibrio inopinatus TaxID=102109 RepID=UPI00040E34D5|nr:methyltransferase domain-containing protein [Desulfovibrio inopinatus]